ncbi:hypothetical protein QRD38_11440 [Leptospira weilii]|uniref:hypothetical protein n=1 Tax=Leptospira weilii TaxID=28184 RepID=UPI00256EFD23|nr:hypothetical protein [Leptospira weilii]MDL5246389.1 hypothetical protein [Leptospira weilii]
MARFLKYAGLGLSFGNFNEARKTLNLKNPFDYLGIDTIRLYLPTSNIEFEEFSRAIRLRNGQKRLKFNDQQSGVIASEFIKSDGFRYYTVRVSLSRLYNGVNYSSYSPFNYKDIIKRLDPILASAGLPVKDWTQVILSRLDVFLNIELEHPYEHYTPILNTISLPRTKPEPYETSKYLKNKQITLMTYDKKDQLEKRKNVKIQDNVLRIELRYLRGQKIKKTFGTNLLFKLKPEQIEKDFYEKLESAFSLLKDFSFQTKDISRKDELTRYFEELNSRFPERFAKEALSYYRKEKQGKLQELLYDLKNIPVQLEKSAESQRKKKERDIKKIQYYVNLGIFLDYSDRESNFALDLIKSAVFHRRLKIARLDEAVKAERRRYNKNEGAMDFSLFTLKDVEKILLKVV